VALGSPSAETLDHVARIDLRDTFIRRAIRGFRAAGLRGSFRVLDLRNLDLEGQFDRTRGVRREAERERPNGTFLNSLGTWATHGDSIHRGQRLES
jgi:hypothetical protein